MEKRLDSDHTQTNNATTAHQNVNNPQTDAHIRELGDTEEHYPAVADDGETPVPP